MISSGPFYNSHWVSVSCRITYVMHVHQMIPQQTCKDGKSIKEQKKKGLETLESSGVRRKRILTYLL